MLAYFPQNLQPRSHYRRIVLVIFKEKNAGAFAKMAERIKSSWDRVRRDLEPVLPKLRAFGISASDIIKAWAQTVGVKSQEIIDHLQRNGIAAETLGDHF